MTPKLASGGTVESEHAEMHSNVDSSVSTEPYDGVKPQPCPLTVSYERFTKKRHHRNHNFGQKFSCTQCEKRFSCRSNLYSHMNIHTGKYKCTECGKCCINNYVLAVHRQRHSGKKLYQRTVCNEQFMTSCDLSTHSRTHSGKKLHKCPMCEKVFSQSGSLKRHMKVHTGEKPYSCSQSDKSELEKHGDYVQSNSQPCCCPYCKKRFKTNFELKRHESIHNQAKPYSCKHCSDCFTWRTQLERHLQLAHSEGT